MREAGSSAWYISDIVAGDGVDMKKNNNIFIFKINKLNKYSAYE